MKQKLEQVIAELEEEALEITFRKDSLSPQVQLFMIGKLDAIGAIVEKLREVIKSDEQVTELRK